MAIHALMCEALLTHNKEAARYALLLCVFFLDFTGFSVYSIYESSHLYVEFNHSLLHLSGLVNA
jgi:hypothetical protein